MTTPVVQVTGVARQFTAFSAPQQQKWTKQVDREFLSKQDGHIQTGLVSVANYYPTPPPPPPPLSSASLVA